LAKNLGSKSIFISDESNNEATFTTKSWDEIYQYLKQIQEKPK
jgi:imidazoleglycerol-phosphate dehydratase/histidinol-phosphatase